MTIDYRGPRCACGKYGCIEALAAGPAIALRAQSNWPGRRLAHRSNWPARLEQIRAEHVGQAFREGDAAARQVLEETAFLLTVWLGNVVDLLEPECIVVGGGMAEMMSPFFADISKNLPKWSINQRVQRDLHRDGTLRRRRRYRRCCRAGGIRARATVARC